MLARVQSALPGGFGLAGLGFLAGSQYAGPLVGSVTAAGALFLGLAFAWPVSSPQLALRRQLQVATVLLGIHAASLYTFGDDGRAGLLPASLQSVLAAIAAVACAVSAARIPPPVPAPSPPPVKTSSARDEDPETTLEIATTATHTVIVETLPAPPVRRAVVGAIATGALLILAVLFWLGDAPPRDALGGARATEVVGALPASSPAAQALAHAESFPAAPEDPATGSAAAEPASDTAAADPAAAGPSIAVASAARRECMAQIESARLFLQIARQSPDATDYTTATDTQIARMLKARPVGPRTLTRIAERMWDKRAEPERDATWWSSQYQRCEAARSSGAWYVVRG